MTRPAAALSTPRSEPAHAPVEAPSGLPLTYPDHMHLAAWRGRHRGYSATVVQDLDAAPDVVAIAPVNGPNTAFSHEGSETHWVWRADDETVRVDSLTDSRTWRLPTLREALAVVAAELAD